jgi:aspartate beta-hydroxylase
MRASPVRASDVAATIVQSAMCRTTSSTIARPRPTLFFFPGLTARPRWDAAKVPWYDHLRAAAPSMAAEYVAMASSQPSDYTTADGTRDGGEHKLHSGSWDWHSYITKGRRQAAFASACPTTSLALESVGADLMVGVPFGFAFFSTLQPGATIARHTAPSNLRLRCHVPITVPADDVSADSEGCGMWLAGEVERWRDIVLFDDCFEHGVWNHTSEPRTLLLFDIWHPDLAPDERRAITEMFAEGARARESRDAADEGTATEATARQPPP